METLRLDTFFWLQVPGNIYRYCVPGYILTQYFRGFTVVWKCQEYELVLVLNLHVSLLLYHKSMYWYICIAQSIPARKWHGFSVGIEIGLIVALVVEIDVISVWGLWFAWFQYRDQNRLGFVWGSKITWFRVWIEMNLVFVSGGHCKIDLFLEWGSKLTRLQCWGRNQLVSCGGNKFTWF